METEQTGESFQVLFVDDEANILRSLRRLFVGEDYDVLTAGSGEEALEIIKDADNLALIVSDQRMPGMTGAQLLEKSKVNAPEALRIVLTGYADLQAATDAINKGGAFRYISKPWNNDELLQTIRDGVEKYALLQKNKRLTAIVKRQNEELQDWNNNLKKRVLAQTANIKKKIESEGIFQQRFKKSFKKSLSTFLNLLELRNDGARRHGELVAEIALWFADDLGLPDELKEQIEIAGQIHDIGKVAFSDAVAGKNYEDLNVNGLIEYENHPARGQAALTDVETLKDVGVIIRHHHENFDGSGFPDCLHGEGIPIGARIITLADFIARTIKKSRHPKAAATLMQRLRNSFGNQFDPALLPSFEKHAEDILTALEAAAEKNLKEMELYPEDLKKGMVVLRDVYSGSGLLLLGKDTNLTESRINGLLRYYDIDPPTDGVPVLACPEDI